MNITHLKELAGKATPGEWVSNNKSPAIVYSNHPDYGYNICDHRLLAERSPDCIEAMSEVHIKDSAYIAAANPATILKLIEVIEQSRLALSNMLEDGDKTDREQAARVLQSIKSLKGE